MIISSILQLFWIYQSNWTCIKWVFSWIYYNNLSHRLFIKNFKIQAEKIIMKITKKICNYYQAHYFHCSTTYLQSKLCVINADYKIKTFNLENIK